MVEGSPVLPEQCQIRPARPDDMAAIRRLVLGEMLDPTQLRYRQFRVIDCSDAVVACGQLRQFGDAEELGSMVVSRSWRGQGLGTVLCQHLIDAASQPLYLECLGQRRADFYQRLGFEPVAWAALPQSLQRKFGFTSRVGKVFRIPIILMRYS